MKCKICGNKTKSLFSFYCDECNKYFDNFKSYIKQLMPYCYTTNKIDDFEEVMSNYKKNINKCIFSSFYEKKMFHVFLKQFIEIFNPILKSERCDIVRIVKIFKIITSVNHKSNLKLQSSKECHKILSIIETVVGTNILNYFDDWISFKISTTEFIKIIDRYKVIDNIKDEICKLCKEHIKNNIIPDYYIDENEIKILQLFEELSQYIDMQKYFIEDKYLQKEYAKAQIMTYIINRETYLIDNKVDVFGIPYDDCIVYDLKNTSCYKRSKKRAYKGCSMGVSIKLAKGVYIRPSTYNVEPVDRECINYVGNVSLYVSLEHIYIRGSYNIDIPIEKLLNLIPHSDSIEFIIDNRHNPVLIETDDAKYIYSLVKYIKDNYIQ